MNNSLNQLRITPTYSVGKNYELQFFLKFFLAIVDGLLF